MRILIYLSLGFAASCGIQAYMENQIGKLLCVLAVLLLGALAGKNTKPLRGVVLTLLGCIGGLFWWTEYNRLYLEPAEQLDGLLQTVQIRVMDDSWETDWGMGFDGLLMLKGKPYQLRVYLNEKALLTPGDNVHGDFRFRVTTPDGAEESVYHQGKGIFLLAYQTDGVYIEEREPSKWDLPALLRRNIRETIQCCFPEDTIAFAKALLIGDTTDLDYETDTNFKISGIRHVVAVSGMHVSILFAMLSTITFRKRWLTALVGFPALFLFAAVAGFNPSVCRSCIMSALILLALLVNKEYDGPTALAFAVGVILLVNPLSVISVSFQMSVASVSGIFLFSGGIQGWIESYFPKKKGRTWKSLLIRWFSTSVSITLSAMVLTTPLCAWYFGAVSLISPVTNLLALWVIGLIFYGVMEVCLLCPFFPAASLFLAKLTALPIRYVLLVARMMADVPLAAVYTCSPSITAWLVFVYVLLILFLVSKNRRPLLLSCCAALGLCFALLAGWAEPMRDSVRFTLLDVGQGQCLLFQTEGKHFLIDCGGDSDAASADMAAETLLSQGITSLDGLILTHLDRDHAGGAANLLSRIETRLLILPQVHTDLPKQTSGEVLFLSEELEILLECTTIRIYPATFPGNSNEMSLCILFDTKNCDILVTGDRNGFGERSLLRNYPIPDVDILVAGHHGAKTSTCEELLTAIRPELVCISVGEGNTYGHPSPELLQRLQAFGCTVYRTDKHGTITIRR